MTSEVDRLTVETKKYVEALDAKMKRKGAVCRITYWKHSVGDDRQVDAYFLVDPEGTKEMAKIVKVSSGDYTVVKL